ncbi:MAG: rhomboid family intramembrane serine protease [candidate division Zixibacteria bacterium]|nr:rhomboid family intramembrane serine protease [candidate division Zixibacteria bacterium]
MSYYYRSYGLGWGGGITRGVKTLLLVNTGVFLIQFILGSKLVFVFGLTPALVKDGYFWQVFTYMFLHGGFFHIFFNMFALFIFGQDIERAWGTKEFIKYYFITGTGAGIINFVLSFNSAIPTIGASGAIFGLLVAFALMYPDRLIYLYFLFPIKARYLVIIFGILELFASFRYTGDGIGHFAHLGGMIIGYLYLKIDWRIGRFFHSVTNVFSRWKEKQGERKREKSKRLLQRADQILDKINQVGYQNLTNKEKKILEEASELLSKEEKG